MAHRVINAGMVLPQQRFRVYLVGFRKDLIGAFADFHWPVLPILPQTVADILEEEVIIINSLCRYSRIV